jgi:hypothetical protein
MTLQSMSRTHSSSVKSTDHLRDFPAGGVHEASTALRDRDLRSIVADAKALEFAFAMQLVNRLECYGVINLPIGPVKIPPE